MRYGRLPTRYTTRPVYAENAADRPKVVKKFLKFPVQIDKVNKHKKFKGDDTFGKGEILWVLPLEGYGRPNQPVPHVAVFQRDDGEVLVIPLSQIGHIKELP